MIQLLQYPILSGYQTACIRLESDGDGAVWNLRVWHDESRHTDVTVGQLL